MSTDTQTSTRPGNLAAALDNPERAELKPCACSFVHVEGEDVRCGRVTKRTFAPGHDAQLKSRLIHAAVNGLTVRRLNTPDGQPQVVSVAEAAGEHGFGYQVADGIARATRLAAEKADRKAARDAVREANRATREAAKQVAAAKREAAREARAEQLAQRVADKANAVAGSSSKPTKTIQAKVGRWTVEGVVKRGELHYTTKKGVAKVAKVGAWSPVA